MNTAIAIELLRLLAKLLEVHKPEDVKAVLQKLAAEGVKPITAADVDAIAAHAAAGEGATEFAWLIERTDLTAPSYWTGVTWSTSADDAMRFARKLDAERAVQTIPGTRPPHQVLEHGWG